MCENCSVKLAAGRPSGWRREVGVRAAGGVKFASGQPSGWRREVDARAAHRLAAKNFNVSEMLFKH
jgi:hypothetical protein